ncbi:serum amyloid P-component-like [Clupea harengus]|uniref:Serum amyloid P-component-like n=1 Tax=Clupea harengus TaxID=7950 RepID=A0A8M1KBN3_CLUHA|nr:serum amyloid P-component-like [Clupea harengus]
MSGKVIIFPVESNTAHVKVTPALNKIFFSVTVCLRFLSDYNKEQAPGDGRYRLYIGDKGVFFYGLPTGLNQWHSVCVTWDSGTGLAQIWVNGRPSARKALQAGASIAGTPSIMLGQDQDAYAGGFHVYDAFYGHATDVHMCDTVLSPSEIKDYMKCVISRPGNVVDWTNMEYSKHGYVIVEPKLTLTCPDSEVA